MRDWPPSNYPIFLALVLLAATAVTLAMGDEKRAEDLAIYAYYMLVIGVAIRFFELTLPENAIQRLNGFKERIYGFVRRLLVGAAFKVGWVAKKFHVPGTKVKFPRLHLTIPKKYFEMVSDISRNVAIFLLLFILISLMYGLMIDWWTVKNYFSNLVLAILGFSTLHVFMKGRM